VSEEITAAAAYDALQQRFGIGEWDEATSTVPYYEARMVEIGKLKRLLHSRRITTTDLMKAADYAVRHRYPISATWQLCALVPEALREHRPSPVATVRDRLLSAAAEATAAGEREWAERLYNADPSAGEEVLIAWHTR